MAPVRSLTCCLCALELQELKRRCLITLLNLFTLTTLSVDVITPDVVTAVISLCTAPLALTNLLALRVAASLTYNSSLHLPMVAFGLLPAVVTLCTAVSEEEDAQDALQSIAIAIHNVTTTAACHSKVSASGAKVPPTAHSRSSLPAVCCRCVKQGRCTA